jgi:small subunit ribosomal protein S1
MTDEIDPTPPADENFAELFAKEEARKSYEVGQIVRGRVVQVGDKETFLDVGAKSEAGIATAELLDDAGVMLYKVGDLVEATVTSSNADGIRLSRKLLQGAQARQALEMAARTGIPVEGKVAGLVKGGFEINIAGLRAFCPHSQIDLRRTDDPQSFIGKTFDFRIIEYRERGKNIVVSRRRILEEAAAEAAQETWKTAVPGAVLTGTIASLTDFGAFVDLGGVRGLIHISEISYERVARAQDVLAVGQQVTVKVLKVEPEKNRISLSMKALAEDPWEAAIAKLNEGEVIRGRLLRVVDFGAFIEIATGVDGLIHVSQSTPETLLQWKGEVASHPEMEVRIVRIDHERKRISLAPVT